MHPSTVVAIVIAVVDNAVVSVSVAVADSTFAGISRANSFFSLLLLLL